MESLVRHHLYSFYEEIGTVGGLYFGERPGPA
jgi:hypothetical protein